MDEPGAAAQIIALILLLFSSAFFSSAETALTTVGKLRIRSLAEEGNKHAVLVAKMIEEPSKMLSTILVGNNIVNLSASALTTSLAMSYGSGWVVSIATGVLTLLILIFGEITPKTMATIHAEKIALAYAPVINALMMILTPVIFLVNKLSLGLLILLRIDPNKRTAAITENELRTIVDVSHEEGVIESEERQMITNVVDFGDSLAKDIMVPRIDMKFASPEMSYEELLEAFREDQYSRMPVYSETRDNVIGIINLKDIFLNYDENTPFNIYDHMREPYFTYEFKKTSELMAQMRAAHISIAIVLDEYGATSGLITLEDLLEEIVGEIRDEYDNDEEDVIRRINDDEYEADGNAKLEDINEAFGLELESDDYDSIAGHIIHVLNHLPAEGEEICEGNVYFTVKEVDKNRIDKVKIVVNAPDVSHEAEAS